MSDYMSIPKIPEPVSDHHAAPMMTEPKILDSQAKTPALADEKKESLLWARREEISALQARWNEIQVMFVDQPRAAVGQADALMVEVLEQIHGMLTNGNKTLNERWVNQQDTSTENLRIVLQDYHKFFNRLLAL